MKWELQANFSNWTTEQVSELARDRTVNPATRSQILAALCGTPLQELARTEHKILLAGREFASEVIARGLAAVRDLTLGGPGPEVLGKMLPFSWLVCLRFSLRKPYLSKDEGDFYVVENAIRKEKVLRLPMVAPTGWKGNLRAAATMGFATWYRPGVATGVSELSGFGRRAGLVRLFGDEKERMRLFLDKIMAEVTGTHADGIGDRFREYLRSIGYQAGNVEGRQGRLFFYATFLDRVGLEIINPHVRDRRVGKNPIVMESAPAGATGGFQLLYVPFDRAGENPRGTALEAAEDLEVVTEAMADMFTERGFGAKTSSGYGVARTRLPEEGSLHVRDAGGSLQERFQSFDELKAATGTLAGRLREFGEGQR